MNGPRCCAQVGCAVVITGHPNRRFCTPHAEARAKASRAHHQRLHGWGRVLDRRCELCGVLFRAPNEHAHHCLDCRTHVRHAPSKHVALPEGPPTVDPIVDAKFRQALATIRATHQFSVTSEIAWGHRPQIEVLDPDLEGMSPRPVRRRAAGGLA